MHNEARACKCRLPATSSRDTAHRIPVLQAAVALVLLLGTIISVRAQVPVIATTAPGRLIDSDEYQRADRLGITFISFINDWGAERYRNALILGAGWNRWPLYWDRVEKQPGNYDWLAYDRLVVEDIRNGLQTNAILLGRPGFYQDGGSVANLFSPIYANGSDTAETDEAINPDNAWARYVHYAVTRYRPGGVLAAHNGFTGDQGIRVWEVWNEPDIPQFWNGGPEAYARLLKTAAIVIKTVDPEAKIVFGGLLYSSDEGFLSRVLRLFRDDPLRARYGWFFDIVAVHSYDDPWRSGWLTKVVQDTLSAFELARPVWVNETGISVWNDYPGPVWAYAPEQRYRLATLEQQAHFLIMSATYAWSKGAEKVFYHQLFDDCGNYPAGTNFPPHKGEHCSQGVCYGDAFGLYRNTVGSHCFNQHPFANSPRPAAKAFQILAEVFGSQPFTPVSLTGLTDAVTMSVFQRYSGERIVVIWNNTFEPRRVTIKATRSGAIMYHVNGSRIPLPANGGSYTLDLKPAGDYSFPDLESTRISAIGGEPVILVERASP